jgi:hypothetical protein
MQDVTVISWQALKLEWLQRPAPESCYTVTGEERKGGGGHERHEKFGGESATNNYDGHAGQT